MRVRDRHSVGIVVEVREDAAAVARLLHEPTRPGIELGVGVAAVVAAGRSVKTDVDERASYWLRNRRAAHIVEAQGDPMPIEQLERLGDVPRRMSEFHHVL